MVCNISLDKNVMTGFWKKWRLPLVPIGCLE